MGPTRSGTTCYVTVRLLTAVGPVSAFDLSLHGTLDKPAKRVVVKPLGPRASRKSDREMGSF
jgi:hypothetical protein